MKLVHEFIWLLVGSSVGLWQSIFQFCRSQYMSWPAERCFSTSFVDL